MNTECLPITYRDFHGVPRAFVVERAGHLYLFDCPFDDERDEYPEEFQVYRLPGEIRGRLSTGTWSDLSRTGELLGMIPVAQVQFDESKRQAIRGSSLQQIERA